MNDNRFKQFVKILKKRVRQDWDCVVAVTGEEGCGKSTLAIQLAMATDENFKLKQNVLFQPKHEVISEKLQKLPNYSSIIADEAIRILYKHDWQKAGSKYVNKVFALARKENQIVFLCIPRFFDLNEYFRNHRVKFWVHVYSRGKAVVLARDEMQFVKDPFHLRENLKTLEHKMHGSKTLDETVVVNIYKKWLPNYSIHFDFLDLEENTKVDYKKLKDEFAYQDLTLEDQSTLRIKIERYETFFVRILKLPTAILGAINKEPRTTINGRVSKRYSLILEEELKHWRLIARRWAWKRFQKDIGSEIDDLFTSDTYKVLETPDSELKKRSRTMNSHNRFKAKGNYHEKAQET